MLNRPGLSSSTKLTFLYFNLLAVLLSAAELSETLIFPANEPSVVKSWPWFRFLSLVPMFASIAYAFSGAIGEYYPDLVRLKTWLTVATVFDFLRITYYLIVEDILRTLESRYVEVGIVFVKFFVILISYRLCNNMVYQLQVETQKKAISALDWALAEVAKNRSSGSLRGSTRQKIKSLARHISSSSSNSISS